ncbi:MAG TPA: ester cyclase [Planctomycetaceae bacterium]|nr:ester cyclase [Planctomycetaceae bacterium]
MYTFPVVSQDRRGAQSRRLRHRSGSSQGMNMAQDIVELARRWFEEVWNERREATIEDLLSPESVCFGESGPVIGHVQFREQMYAPLLAAFPDVRVTIDDILGVGDQAVVRWTATGTHTGTGMGISPTRKPVTFQGMTWIHARDGKLLQGWQSSNIAETIRSLAESAD